MIATLGYDCGSGSGGGGRQQRWLAMAGDSKGWLWLVAAPGEDNECNGGRRGFMGIATDSFQLPPSIHYSVILANCLVGEIIVRFHCYHRTRSLRK